MSIRNVAVGCDAEDDIVAGDVAKSDLLRQHPRRVFWYPVQYLSDLAVCHSANRFTIPPPVFIARGTVMMRIPVGANLDPIGREPLGRVNVPVDRRDGAAMARIVRGAFPRQPYATIERRTQNRYGAAVYWNRKIFERGFRCPGTFSVSGRKDHPMPHATGRSCIQTKFDPKKHHRTFPWIDSLCALGAVV